ncbi:MAG: hypothetical protein LBJ02_03945, partial [Bifidobacteriaceae bacterium]|nr:hypothetical protein [Bifidobacteriaceae bacterium]
MTPVTMAAKPTARLVPRETHRRPLPPSLGTALGLGDSVPPLGDGAASMGMGEELGAFVASSPRFPDRGFT